MILQLVTDRRRLCGAADPELRRQCLLRQVQYGIDAGVDFLQVREPDLEAGELAALVGDIVGRVRGSRTAVLVNDRVDVALASGAAGVHLRADSVPAAAVRSITPRGFVIGQSVHAPDEAVAAAPDVDYLIAGTVWPSASKPTGHPLLGPTGLASLVGAVGVPVLAIGGVTLDRLADIAATGAAGIAGIGLFMSVPEGVPADGCRAIRLGDVVGAARRRFDTPGSPF